VLIHLVHTLDRKPVTLVFHFRERERKYQPYDDAGVSKECTHTHVLGGRKVGGKAVYGKKLMEAKRALCSESIFLLFFLFSLSLLTTSYLVKKKEDRKASRGSPFFFFMGLIYNFFFFKKKATLVGKKEGFV